MKNMKFMWQRSWNFARSIYPHIIMQTAMQMAQPFIMLYLSKYILDELAGEKRVDVTVRYLCFYAAATVFFGIVPTLIQRSKTIRTLRINQNMTMYHHAKWGYMDYGNFEDGRVRDLAEKSIGAVEPKSFAENTVAGFISELVQLIGYSYIIASIHPLMVVFLLLVIATNAYASRRCDKIGYEYQSILTRINRCITSIWLSMLYFDFAKEIRINGAAEWLHKKYDDKVSEYIDNCMTNQKKQFKYRALPFFTEMLQTVAVYGYCAYLVISGGITVGSFTVFLGAISAFSWTLSCFVNRFSGLALLSGYVDDYKEFLSYADHKGKEKEVVTGDELPAKCGALEFVDVSFIYPNTDRFVLKNVNIKIKAGERLSVVGYNGAGKTTFIKLICRLYEPTMGKILLDGVDISTINLADYRERISVVFQDFQLFWMTICENVAMNREVDEARMITALEQSGLGEKLATLDEGIYTHIGRAFDYKGNELSGGEGQKLACARAYYKDAPIIILDEPTASLDSIAETTLYNRFQSIIKNKTSIYISHRLASVKFCDSVAMFADGELVERGTHSELMALGGVYADMFSKQASYYVDKTDKTDKTDESDESDESEEENEE